jgi:hypothetical protein
LYKLASSSLSSSVSKVSSNFGSIYFSSTSLAFTETTRKNEVLDNSSSCSNSFLRFVLSVSISFFSTSETSETFILAVGVILLCFAFSFLFSLINFLILAQKIC